MPVSTHSHSGQFCAHASNTLEEMVQAAIAKEMRVYALTEHMPRGPEDLYPEEVAAGQTSKGLEDLYARFIVEATRLRDKYSDRIDILIGFESEWLRMSLDEKGARENTNSLALVRQLQEKYSHVLDFYIGSVHHVYDIPIDYSREMYLQARALSHDSGKDHNVVRLANDHSHGDMDEALFKDYFDAQYDMLCALKPPVVGHFDLIRLYSDRPNDSLQCFVRVWKSVIRNLEYIVGYGGLLEINSSAVRKELKEPYPQMEICKTFLEMGGKFTISDDSHRTGDVGMNYHVIRKQVELLGLREFHIPRRTKVDEDNHAEPKEYETYQLDISLIKNLATWAQ